MSNATRIIRKNRITPGITVYRDTMPSGETVYITDRGEKYIHPYVCAVRRRPYNGNSDRMRGGS